MEKKGMYLSLDLLAERRGKELCSLGTGDGATRALFSSGSIKKYPAIEDCTFGLRSKFPAYKGWKDSEE